MTDPPSYEITTILQAMRAGDPAAQQRLIAIAYDELRRIAMSMMQRERADHTLQPTALVHEAVLRFFDAARSDDAIPVPDRAYFFASMAQAMRRILVDHARSKAAQKRGGGMPRVPLDVTLQYVEASCGLEMLQFDETLERLEQLDARTFQVVMLRFFSGLEMDQIAEQLSVSPSTVDRDWRFARAWMKKELEG